jgi:hypothetical protein
MGIGQPTDLVRTREANRERQPRLIAGDEAPGCERVVIETPQRTVEVAGGLNYYVRRHQAKIQAEMCEHRAGGHG